MNLRPYLDFTKSLAYRAGRISLGYFNTGIRPDFKANEEPVTAADRAAEEFIRAGPWFCSREGYWPLTPHSSPRS